MSKETFFKIFVFSLLATGCASKNKIPKFVEGCMFGTIMTYNHLLGQPFPQEYINQLYAHCEQAENGKNH